MKQADILNKFFDGDRLALARMITKAENSHNSRDPVLDEVLKQSKGSFRIGVTGPPGAGKSTLLDRMVVQFRQDGKTVGVIAVDPTSPFTGGAILGDRIRMNSIQQDPGVFIRSMATRGSLGGLAHTTQEIADVFDSFGKDIIFIETVGVGQSELDVVQAADTILVVLVPESGDSIQAMKAGLMEIADIFVLNKSDHEYAKRAYSDLNSVLHLNRSHNGWWPSIVQTVANTGEGFDKLFEQLTKHKAYLEDNNVLENKRRERTHDRLKSKVNQKIFKQFWNPKKLVDFEQYIEEILNGKLSYNEALEKILK